MNGQVPVIEAVEWREPAPDGGSKAQVFRLSDGRFAIVKFPENPQGELVLANEFLSSDILNQCANSAELHAIVVFEQLVYRQDGRQLLMYPTDSGPTKRFAAYDYGFAFGGQPNWSAATLGGLAPVLLPSNDPFSGQPYRDVANLSEIINRLRALTSQQLTEILMKLHPPRWGLTLVDVQALIPVLVGRAKALVSQFDERHQKQLEVF